jgi:uncharacterized protein
VAALNETPTIQVRGNAMVRAEPDEALLSITLTKVDAPGPALADVSARSRTLVTMLDELAIPAANRTTTGVSVSEEVEHTNRGRRSLGHRATTRVALRLTAPELIGELVSRVVGELDARIDGPQWRIAVDNPIRLEAAREAARDAERKARAYVEGLGARLGRPLRLTEADSRNSPLAGAWVAAGGGGFEPVPIDPGEHEVFASIEVTFALEPDDGHA